MTIKRFHIGPRMSQVVIHGRTIYLAGQVADDPVLRSGSRPEQILAKIDRLLAEAGIDKSKILSANVWLVGHWPLRGNERSVGRVGRARRATPARATVEAKLARPANLVEVMVVASAG